MPAATPLPYGDQHDTAAELADARKRFEAVFGPGGAVRAVRSPGRVNLIGEHTDYNDGFVLPMAIEPHVLVVFRERTDGKVRLATTMYANLVAEFSLAGLAAELDLIEHPTTADPKPPPAWYDYSKGMLAMLAKAGDVPLKGMDALLNSTIPSGGGLSSSAALEVGTGLAMRTLGGLTAGDDQAKMALAYEGKAAENVFVGMPCGIMDQAIVALGRAGTAMLLDCRSNEPTFIRIDNAAVRVVIVNSMAKHALVDGGYAARKASCEKGVAILRKRFPDAKPPIKALRDVTMDQLTATKADMDEQTFRRCRHVVTEIPRTERAAKLLDGGDYEAFGKLMVQSHDSLRDDYTVSTPELDFLVEQAKSFPGVFGARMTGGGFGGCIVALAEPAAVDALSAHVAKVYPAKTGKTPEIVVTSAMDGARVVA